MSNEHKLTAWGRKDEGKGASRRLRRAGRLPAVIYGAGAEPQSIELEQEPVWLAQQHDWFYASIISLDVDGKAQDVLLRDMQRHPYKQVIMHLDFQRVKAGEKIHVKVPLHFVNIDSSPAGKSAEVSVTSELNDLDVVVLPRNLPEFIEIDLGKMEAGDTVYLADIKLPKGVELAHPISDEHNPAVAVARFVKVEEASAEGETEAGDVPAAKQEGAE
ncbi:50S ribosomal protein L25/general stress protein Ctc [Lysobacter pythonis]|uniref:Large ribosomal subunit protein bL25 n=1 Tax=Solilutibacter pythonis TaxID=2483112 RepID=A0A3M2HIE1_9GAMM|nr:50S ribosomal protein L25/general stress protein Ctc [Lysobacter pythonis]RMH89486.1 50S ribosomal protein L25/general stress protein Ctc [Lysobacter pythonis]